ncbi:MAG: Na(+)-translocating NADH-quinone reductase subunit C [Nitrospiraceae bacterium]|nr:MAG: Na(+)-translocating NADH-quinone reductase subunit C [Nitrospiraceae bacterium]
MPAESVKRTIMIALGVCIVCSVLVSTAAVSLKGIQEENRRLDRIKNILMAGDLLDGNRDLNQIYEETIQPLLVELASGRVLQQKDFELGLNIRDFDIQTVAADREHGRVIPAERDAAGIRRMPKYMVVYPVMKSGNVDKIILPVYGKGLWSTLYGFIALGSDLRTVQGFTIYEHGETPGLGGEVDNPRWKNIWKGKKAFDDEGNLRIRVIKGNVDTEKNEALYEIDGLSGATWTTIGVDNLVRFWLGDEGYAHFLKRLKEEIHG